MGNHSNTAKIAEKDKNHSQAKAVAKADNEMSIKKFNRINVVGKGGFGKVIYESLSPGLGHLVKKTKKTICTQGNVQS